MKIHELIKEDNTALAVGKGLIQGGKAVKSGIGKLAMKGLEKIAPKVITNPEYGAGALKFFGISNTIMTLLSILGIGQMCREYNNAVNGAQKMLEKGEWTQAEFDDYRQGKMTKLILEIAASTLLFSKLKMISGWQTWTLACRYNPLGLTGIKAFGAFLGATSEAARLAFVGYLLSPSGQEARKAVAELIGQGIIDNTIGGNGVALVDKVKHFFDESKKDGEWKNPLAPAVGADATAKADDTTNTPNVAVAAKKYDDESDFAYDKSKYSRGPTGALIPKINIEK